MEYRHSKVPYTYILQATIATAAHLLAMLYNFLNTALALVELAALVQHLIESTVALVLDHRSTGCTGRRMTSFGTGMHTAWWTCHGTSQLAIDTARLLLHVIQLRHSMTDTRAAVIATLQLACTRTRTRCGLGVPAGPIGHLMATNAGDTHGLLATRMWQCAVFILQGKKV